MAAAKKEGEIVYDVTRSTSGAERHVVPDFQAAFPGIRVTQTVSDSSNVFIAWPWRLEHCMGPSAAACRAK